MFPALLLAAAIVASPSPAGAQHVEDFDGSFRLETGQVVTGGYIDESEGAWLYMDVENLDRGGLFERDGDVLRSTLPPGGVVEVRFVAGADGSYDELIWKAGGSEIVGKRVAHHTTREVQFTSDDGTLLDGRLLVPRCVGPHPAIVTVHGSGPGSRYGGTFHTFFLKHGVAVLAYEKRGQTADGWREPDLAALSADAAAGVRFVANLPEIDRDRVGLWGSSQGGWVVPAAALDARETSFMILRAGAVVSEAETNLHEVRQEARAEGLEGLDLDAAIDLRREIYDVAMRGEPKSAADALVEPYLQEEWYRIAFGDGPISSLWSDRWWGWAQRNLSVTSAPDVAAFGGPVLWFLGERDEAVPLISTRAALERAFDESPGDDHEIVVLPDAPHSFLIQPEEGPPHYAEGMFSRTVEWMTERGLTGSCGL